MAVRALSSDHISVAIHPFGGTGRPLLLSHATGFHGHCYLPLADHLDDRCTSWAFDHRGHGDTPRPDDWAVDWTRYGDDALAVAQIVAEDAGEPLVAFGHSMGGASLLMAARRRPELFDTLIVFEPIVFPTDIDRSSQEPSPLVEGARRRRSSFPSFEDAIENYSSKRPMSAFDSDVVRLYVGHGLRPAPEGVRLACAPEHEARTFEQGAAHNTWDVLGEIETRVIVVAGGETMGPAEVAPEVANRLANATFISQPDADHFGPFVDPRGTADLIAAFAG